MRGPDMTNQHMITRRVSLDPQKEPKAIERFIDSGHPWLAFIISMSWLWRGVAGAAIAACLWTWLA